MAIRKLLRALRGGAPALAGGRDAERPVPARRPAAQAPEAFVIELEKLAQIWNQPGRRLEVSATVAIQPGQKFPLRIVSRTSGVDVVVDGTAASIRQEGGGWTVVVALDQEGTATAERLSAAARGQGEPLAPRQPRYRVSMPAVVSGGTGKTFMNTVSVSQDGCGLAWSGPAPRVGSGLVLQIGSGTRTVAIRAMTCWCRQTSRGTRVGVRFLDDSRPGWPELLADLGKRAERD